MAVAAPQDAFGSKYSDRPYDELVEALMGVHAVECAVVAEKLKLVAEIAQRDNWISEGANSVSDFLCFKLGLPKGEAQVFVETAQSLAALPYIADAFAQGRISYPRVVLLAKFVDTPEDDETFANNQHEYNISELRRRAREKEDVKPEDSEDAMNVRSLKFRRRGQRGVMNASFPLDWCDVAEKALSRMVDSDGLDPETGLYAPRDQRMLDAFVEICSVQLGADGDPDRANISVEIDLADLIENGNGDLEYRSTIPTETVQRLMCDSRIQFRAMQDAEAFGIGRASRTIPPAMNRRLRRRDQGCRFTGCWRTRWTHGHHIWFWSEGGPTQLDNLILLCPLHHHFVHEQHWTIHGNPNGRVEFHKPDGTLFTSEVPPRSDVWDDLVRRIKDDDPSFTLFDEPDIADSA